MQLSSKDLVWVDFCSMEALRQFEKQKPVSGIYIWGWFKHDNNFIPFYVGKHYNLHQRLFEHIGCLNGGLYTIYEKSLVLSGNFKPWRIDNTNLPIYSPIGVGNFIDVFMSENVQNAVKWYVANIQFTWMITDPSDNEYLEKYVALKLEQKGYFVSSFIRGYKNINEPDQMITFGGNSQIVNMLI